MQRSLNECLGNLFSPTEIYFSLCLTFTDVFYLFAFFPFYREKLRHEKILCSLAGNITTSHTIYPSFGTAEFFEFVLRNPYSTEQNITIHCDDNELKYE